MDNPEFGLNKQSNNTLFESVWDIVESFGTDKKYV